MKRRFLGCLAVFVLLASTASHALADEMPFREGAFHLTPTVGPIFFLGGVGNYDMDTQAIFGGRVGYFFRDNISFEGSFEYAFSHYSALPFLVTPPGQPYDGLRANNFYVLFNGLYHFRPLMDDKLIPFFLGGIGMKRIETSLANDPTGFVGQYGIGAHYMLTDDLYARGELRHVLNTNPSESTLVLSFGVSWLIGGKHPAPPPPPPPPPMDSDGDGVPDHLDQCPDTPMGCIVDEVGCPRDSDFDGVCNGIDECPDTPRPGKVDEKGCPVAPEAWTEDWESGLRFKVGQAALAPGSEAALSLSLERLKEFPQAVVEIGGYCDSTGSAVVNKRLSEARARSVRNFLVLNGVEPDRLVVVGYGATNFVADNDTPRGRALNRRVEFKVLGNNGIGLKVLFFKVGKSELTDQSQKDLGDVAQKLGQAQGVRVEVGAYTDSSGGAELNKRLSQKRAEAVRDKLISMGVPAERLKAVGHGEENPIDDNAKAEGRAKNRRIEFKVIWRQ